MRLRDLFLLLGLAACATEPVAPPSGQARFSAFPDELYTAFQAACTGPAQAYDRPRPGFAECQEFLPPDMTASIILGFDGTIDDLPRLVIRFTTTEDGAEFLVDNDVFLSVPRRDNTVAEVRVPDRRISRTIDALYRRAGGVPVPASPGDGATGDAPG